MAGEIHDFNKKRKRPNWQDDRSTGKYYDSGDISAIRGQNSAADSTLSPGEEPKGEKYVPPKHDDRRADKYYENRKKPGLTKQQIAQLQKQERKALGKPAQLGKQQESKMKHTVDSTMDMTINNPGEVNGVLHEVVSRLQSGHTGIVVYVETGNAPLLRRTRTALEMLVTREVITEEMYHEVRLSYTPGKQETASIEQMLGTPEPKGEKVCDAVDSEAFLAGTLSDDDAEEASIVAGTGEAAVMVDTTDDVPSSPAPSYPSAPADNTDDDSDFLSMPEDNKESPPAYVPPGCKKVPEPSSKPTHVIGKPTGSVPISEPKPTPSTVTLGGDIVATESMEGIGGTPKSKKAGKRSGRGAK